MLRVLNAMKNRLLLLSVILIATAVSYSNAIHGEFQFDDDTFITENPGIKNLSNLFPKNIASLLSPGSRLLAMLTFSINYRVGGMSVEGYHMLNILFHLMSTVLIYFFFMGILSSQPFRDSLGSKPDSLACVIAGIFALHPIQTQAVTYVIQRAEVLASLLYLLSLLFLIRFSDSYGKKSLAFWLLAALSFFAGWLSKQVVITAPAVFFLYVLFFGERRHLKKSILGISPIIVAGLFFGVREILSFQGSTHIGFNIRGLGQPEYFFTEMSVLLTYIRLLFFPVNQNLDYDYPIYRSFFNIDVIGLFLFWLVILIISFCTLKVQGRWKYHARGMGFGVLWFLTILLPTSSLIPLADVIYEHRVYLAMAGIIFSIALGTDMLFFALKRRYAGNAYQILVIFIMVLFTFLPAATYARNRVWLTKSSLWLDVVKKSPMKSRPHNNLGNCYYLKRDFIPALRHYQIAINLDPENAEAYYNTAVTMEMLGRKADAVFYYLKFREKAHGRYTPLVKDIERKLGVTGRVGWP